MADAEGVQLVQDAFWRKEKLRRRLQLAEDMARRDPVWAAKMAKRHAEFNAKHSALAAVPSPSSAVAEDAERRQAIENAVANVFAAWTPTECSTNFPGQAVASAVSSITPAAALTPPTSIGDTILELAMSDKALEVDAADVAAPTPTTCSTGCPSCDASEESALTSSAAPPSSTTIGSVAPEPAAEELLEGGDDVTSPSPTYVDAVVSVTTNMVKTAALCPTKPFTEHKLIGVESLHTPLTLPRCVTFRDSNRHMDMPQSFLLDDFVLESTQMMFWAAKNPWPPPPSNRSTTGRILNRQSTLYVMQLPGDLQDLKTVELTWSAALTVLSFVPGVQIAQLKPTVFKWADLSCFVTHLISASTLDLLLARQAAHTVCNWCCLDHLHCCFPGSIHWAIPHWGLLIPSPVTWLHVNCDFARVHFQWAIAVQRYINSSSSAVLASLNGRAAVQQHHTCTRVLPVAVRQGWISHHVLRDMLGSMQDNCHLSLPFCPQCVQQTNAVFEAPLCRERHRIRIFWSGVAPSLLMADLLQETLNESGYKPKYSVPITYCESGYMLLHTSLLWRTSAVCIFLCWSAWFQWKVAWLFYHHYCLNAFLDKIHFDHLKDYLDFDQVRVNKDYYLDDAIVFDLDRFYLNTFLGQVCIGHDYYLGVFLEQVRVICYLNLVKVCLDSGIRRYLVEVTKLQVPWDPGGSTRHRLAGKPHSKEGGMLATSPTFAMGWAVAAPIGLGLL